MNTAALFTESKLYQNGQLLLDEATVMDYDGFEFKVAQRKNNQVAFYKLSPEDVHKLLYVPSHKKGLLGRLHTDFSIRRKKSTRRSRRKKQRSKTRVTRRYSH